MTTKLRLELHRITLQKKIEGERYPKLEKRNFSEFINLFDSDRKTALSLLWTKFVEEFENKFRISLEGDKAVTASENCEHCVSTENSSIDGELYGGPTNREQSIYKQGNASKTINKVDTDDVVSSKFYIKLWLPYDYSTGVLMIQSYTTSNISDLIRDQFAKFVQKYGYKLTITSYYPKSFMEERNKRSNVVAVSYVKDKLSKGKLKLIHPLFAEFDDLKIKIEISGFKTSVSDFRKRFKNNGEPLGIDINELGLRKEDVTVVAKYVDDEGRSTTMNIDENRVRNFAYYILPEEILQSGKNTYVFDEIKKHTDSILREIKQEIGYSRQK
ncbi:MAG: hypothetical protein J6Y78_17050 [Paludibacteraceae bacterium]|nr:hypothetical protein [Paludibacteraceae bacterium]